MMNHQNDKKWLTLEELVQGLDRLQAVDPDAYALACFIADTGARLNEALRVRSDDLGEGNGRVVPVRVPGSKGGDQRISYVTAETAALLAGRHGVLFTGARRSYQRALGRAGVTARSLRHTCITWLLSNGADLISVMNIAGHKKVTSTAVYAGLTEDSMAERRKWVHDGLYGRGPDQRRLRKKVSGLHFR